MPYLNATQFKIVPRGFLNNLQSKSTVTRQLRTPAPAVMPFEQGALNADYGQLLHGPDISRTPRYTHAMMRRAAFWTAEKHRAPLRPALKRRVLKSDQTLIMRYRDLLGTRLHTPSAIVTGLPIDGILSAPFSSNERAVAVHFAIKQEIMAGRGWGVVRLKGTFLGDQYFPVSPKQLDQIRDWLCDRELRVKIKQRLSIVYEVIPTFQ